MELKIGNEQARGFAQGRALGMSSPLVRESVTALLLDRAAMLAEIDKLKIERNDEKRGHATTAQALFESNAALKAVTAERDAAMAERNVANSPSSAASNPVGRESELLAAAHRAFGPAAWRGYMPAVVMAIRALIKLEDKP